MPGRLNRRGIFDPRFSTSFGFVQNRAMTSTVLIRRKVTTGGTPQHNFDTGVRATEGRYIELWRGMAKVTPNKDWRARGYEFGNESTVFQAVRIDIPLLGGAWLAEDVERFFLDEDQAIIEANAPAFRGLDPIKKYLYIVRNPVMSGVAGEQNLLCDVDLKGGLAVGN